jgi:hypothetical protein
MCAVNFTIRHLPQNNDEIKNIQDKYIIFINKKAGGCRLFISFKSDYFVAFFATMYQNFFASVKVVMYWFVATFDTNVKVP